MPRGPSTEPRPALAGTSPAADRPQRQRWRDPKVVVGIAVVAVCALLGARLLGSAADDVDVWAARASLQEGQQVGPDDVVRRQVRFTDQADADRYLSADADVPASSTLARDVGAGELVPRGALAATAGGSVTEVPLTVDSEAVPSTVREGSTVDVWVTPDSSAAKAVTSLDGPSAPRSTLVFDDVRVVSVPAVGSSLGPTATRQVIIGAGEDQQDRLPRAIAALSAGTVVLTVQR